MSQLEQIDKESFGRFLAQTRREKGLTQKELAEKLFVSDKAVSKWERGLSLPDVSLLLPLADILGLSVTELLESRRLSQEDCSQGEELVQKALSFSQQSHRPSKAQRLRRLPAYLASLAASLALLGLTYVFLGRPFPLPGTMVLPILSYIFGLHFLFFAQERLPSYYDDNYVTSYSDGFFRMNMAGVRFTNSNWPHILHSCRLWCLLSSPLSLVYYLAAALLFPDRLDEPLLSICLLLIFLGSLFIPIWLAARKHG